MRLSRLFVPALFIASMPLNASVPDPRFRKPAVPGFLQPMEFRTVMMQTFPSEVSGMVPDRVSDLMWNPATLAGLSKRTAYLDFFSAADNPVFAASAASADPAVSARNWTDEFAAPRWYPQTSVVPSESRPLVSLGLLLPVNRRLSLALFDRVTFDYGPFLQSMSGGGGWNAETADASYYDKARDVTLSRLETGHNQQTTAGNRIEAVIGWRAADRLDLGLRLGHMVYHRNGELLEDDWANYPHSSSAGLEDESLEIRGSQIEAGLGAMFRPDCTFRVGVYGGLISGDGSERSVALDTTAGWSEQDTDPRYFSRSASFLTADQSYDADGVRPLVSANAEKRFSENWLMRAFVSYSWSETDVSGALASSDTTSGDRGYDYWQSGSTFYRRTRSQGSRAGSLEGDGTEKTGTWKGFVSAVYAPRGCWSLFGGLHVQHQRFTRDFSENGRTQSHSMSVHTIYAPGSERSYYHHTRQYTTETEIDRWSLALPVGLRIGAAKGFSALIGASAAFMLEDESVSGFRVYPVKTTRRWQNGSLIVDDLEIDRAERFDSDPAKVLTRQLGRYFGLVYSHPAGVQAYLKFADDFSQMSGWTIGFGMEW
ncbi:hypothetical protein JW777_02715 [bacterium]|nr:hypothetical protein [bacterium]